MARVPTEDGPQVATAPLRPQYLRPSDTSNQFGAASGRALQGVGQEISKVGARIGEVATVLQVDENERQIKKADVALSEGYRILLTGDGTPENPGYRSLRGEQALEALPALKERMTQLRQSTIEAVPGNKAKSTFSVASELREQQAFGLAAAHSVAQQEVASEAVDLARFKSAVSSAAGAYNDPIALATHISVAESAAKSAAARKSQDPVVLEQAAQAARTDGYKAAILGAVKGDDMGEAQRLFALHKDKMDGVAANELAKTLFAHADRAQSQGVVDAIMQAGGTLEQSLATIRQNYSGKQEDDMVSRVIARFEEKEKAKTDADEALVSSVFGAINGENSMSLDQYRTENPEAFGRIAQDPNLYDAVVKADLNRAKGLRHAKVSNEAALTTLRLMSDEELAGTDIVKFRDQFTLRDYEDLQDRKEAAIDALKATGGTKAEYASGRAALYRFAPKDVNDKSVLTSGQMNALEMDMNEWVHANSLKGRKVSELEIAKHAQGLMLPLIKLSGGFFGSSESVIGVIGVAGKQKPSDRLRLRADGPVMTGEEIAAVNGILIQQGQTPTPELLEAAVLRRRELRADKQRRELEERNR